MIKFGDFSEDFDWEDGENEDRELCDAMNTFEMNGGCFSCSCRAYRDKRSEKMGVRERQYDMRVSGVVVVGWW